MSELHHAGGEHSVETSPPATSRSPGADAPLRAGAGNITHAPPAPMFAWLLALLLCTGLIAFYRLDTGADFEPIDCWVAQTAREMADRGDYLVPHFAGETRMQKSPGPYWAVIGVSRLLGTGVTEVAARIPNGLAALVLVATLFGLTRQMAGNRAAIFAGFAVSCSTLTLHWSHRGASDFGLTALMTLSLACFWSAAQAGRGGRRGGLTLLAWFAAGLAMIYKMPMPVVCIGLPLGLYCLWRRHWGYVFSGWHLPGLVFFLLPWLPWAIAVALAEPTAFAKWRVEYLDRFTGDLPNVQSQFTLAFYFLYLLPPVLFCLPFSLSLPTALMRAFRISAGRATIGGPGDQTQAGLPSASTQRDAMAFLLIWFFSHFAFFTASTGKELRYFLPALPPLFVLLGIELAAFFNPGRARRPGRDRLALIAVWLLAPAALFGGGIVGMRRWHKAFGIFTWEQVLTPYLVAALILSLGIMLAAWLYVRRQEHASFAALVATMWVSWLWIWPCVMPIVQSQQPFRDIARQVREFRDSGLPEAQTPIYHVSSQDSRIIWYGDLRPLPRVIDQLELLRMQGGRRSLANEIRLTAAEMIRKLRGADPVLFMATRFDYLLFRLEAPVELAKAGETMPPVHLWFQTRVGPKIKQYTVFGNRPPPWPEPPLTPPSEKNFPPGSVAPTPPAATSPAVAKE